MGEAQAFASKNKAEPSKWQDGTAGGPLEDAPVVEQGTIFAPHGSPFPAEECWLLGQSSKSRNGDEVSETHLLQISNTIHISWSLYFPVHFTLRLKLLNLNPTLLLA